MDPFSDIAAGRDSGGQFESFAQQFLEGMGLVTISSASRGTDGGRDLIMAERFMTKLGREIDYRWLVSCKFRSAATGRAIAPSDEPMIIDRLQRHDCNGFIGFYSTGPSTNLVEHIDALANTTVAQIHMFNHIIFDGAAITGKLNSDIARFGSLMQTFMPAYYARQTAQPAAAEDNFNITEEDHE